MKCNFCWMSNFPKQNDRHLFNVFKQFIVLIAAVMVLSTFTLTVSASEITANETGDRNILFSNGYRGFCIDNKLHGASSGDSFVAANTSVAISNYDGSDISQSLKVFFTQCFEDIFQTDGNGAYWIKDTNTVQAVTWHYSDNQHVWGDMKKLADATDAYNGPAIPDSGYTRTLSNGDVITFHFMVIHSKNDSLQDFFAYKFTVTQATAHEHEFGNTWMSSDTEHWHECECGEKDALADHIETVINRKEPSEFEDGYTGDTVCEICDQLLEEGERIPATHEHSFSVTWITSVTQHWHECGCGEKDALADHIETVINRKEPSEFEAGYTGDTVCEVCNLLLEQGESIPATHEHSFSVTWITSVTQHWHECACGEKDALADHVQTLRNRKEPSEFESGYTGDAVCEVCDLLMEEGEQIPATHVHNFGETWEFSDIEHWQECACGASTNRVSHKGGEPTCKDFPICSECNKPYGFKDPDKHVGGTQLRGFIASTEDTIGYTGDVYCLSCNEMIRQGLVTPKLPKEYSEAYYDCSPPTGDRFPLHFWLNLSWVSLIGCVFAFSSFKNKYKK